MRYEKVDCSAVDSPSPVALTKKLTPGLFFFFFFQFLCLLESLRYLANKDSLQIALLLRLQIWLTITTTNSKFNLPIQ